MSFMHEFSAHAKHQIGVLYAQTALGLILSTGLKGVDLQCPAREGSDRYRVHVRSVGSQGEHLVTVDADVMANATHLIAFKFGDGVTAVYGKVIPVEAIRADYEANKDADGRWNFDRDIITHHPEAWDILHIIPLVEERLGFLDEAA